MKTSLLFMDVILAISLYLCAPNFCARAEIKPGEMSNEQLDEAFDLGLALLQEFPDPNAEKPIEKQKFASPVLTRASKEEEDRLIAFVKAHPEVDFASFHVPVTADIQKDGHERTLVACAARFNFTNLLEVLERENKAISRYRYQRESDSPLFEAYACQSTDALVKLANMRPDWLLNPLNGASIVFYMVAMGDKATLHRLLDLGADVDAIYPLDGRTLLDHVSSDSDWFDLVRTHGGRRLFLAHGVDEIKSPVPAKYRERKIQQYFNEVVQVYSNRMVFQNGSSVALPGFDMADCWLGSIQMAKWRELSGEEERALEQDLKTQGDRCGGVVVFRCYGGGVYHLRSHIEPILNRLNVIGIYLTQNGVGSPYVRQRDFCPFLPPATLPKPDEDSASAVQSWQPSAEESALTVEWKYQAGKITREAYVERLQRLGFVVSSNSIAEK